MTHSVQLNPDVFPDSAYPPIHAVPDGVTVVGFLYHTMLEPIPAQYALAAAMGVQAGELGFMSGRDGYRYYVYFASTVKQSTILAFVTRLQRGIVSQQSDLSADRFQIVYSQSPAPWTPTTRAPIVLEEQTMEMRVPLIVIGAAAIFVLLGVGLVLYLTRRAGTELLSAGGISRTNGAMTQNEQQ
eukprot:PhM_4_TR4640/c0_g1_i2/m.31301